MEIFMLLTSRGYYMDINKEVILETRKIGVTTVHVPFLWRRSMTIIRFQKGWLIPNVEFTYQCM